VLVIDSNGITLFFPLRPEFSAIWLKKMLRSFLGSWLVTMGVVF